jgi:drug/metabolite transporter (DMT)-like permease
MAFMYGFILNKEVITIKQLIGGILIIGSDIFRN